MTIIKKTIFIISCFLVLGCASVQWVKTDRATLSLEEVKAQCWYENNKLNLQSGSQATAVSMYYFIKSCMRLHGYIDPDDS